MQIFEFRNEVIADYRKYIESFISISDPLIRQTVDHALQDGLLWRDPLVQINPNFAPGKKIDDLVAEQLLHPECGRIFRRNKKETNGSGYPLNLHLHQEEAIRLACEKKNYILCTGRRLYNAFPVRYARSFREPSASKTQTGVSMKSWLL